ncbi:hypothetical protein C8F01DRAFT_648645 [Mycena amicta]|nr:hypothetical protein C8F01DRAFT_648645 [Mycena amicta]
MSLSPILNVACSWPRLAPMTLASLIEIVVGSAGYHPHPGNVASQDILFSDPSPTYAACECVCVWIYSDGLAFHNFPPVTNSTSDCRPWNLLHPVSDTSNHELGTAGDSLTEAFAYDTASPSPILDFACSLLRLTDDAGISSSRLSLALQDAPATLAT